MPRKAYISCMKTKLFANAMALIFLVASVSLAASCGADVDGPACQADDTLSPCEDPACDKTLYSPGWCIADTCVTDDDCKAWNGLWCDPKSACVGIDGCARKGWCVGKRPAGEPCTRDAQCCSNACRPDTAQPGSMRCLTQQLDIVASC